MATLISIIGYAVLAAFIIAVIVCLIFLLQYIMYFHYRQCRHCGHTLEYKGLKEDSGNGHHLFHCPKCGAWEQITPEDFFRDIDKGYNPNNL